VLALPSGCYTGAESTRSDGAGVEDIEDACDPDAPDAGLRDGRRLSRAEYQYVIGDLFDLPPSERYPGPFGRSATGFSTEPAINVVGEVSVEDIMLAAEDVALELPDMLDALLPCAAVAADTACAQEYLATTGRMAFRRTLTDAERTTLLTVFEDERADEATFAEAIGVMTAQMLQMPAFLYVMEAPTANDGPRRLSSVELASRLSFYLWNSIPDVELLDRAEAGALDDDDAVLAEAQRMFDDPRSRRGFSRFFREWTQIEPLTVGSKDPTQFPELTDGLADAINNSFERYVTGAVRSGTTFAELLTDPRTVVDAELAEFFGIDPVDDWTVVDLPGDRYAGLVTQPAVMAGLAHATETSYVLRGRFVRQRLLCEPHLPPPGNAMTAFGDLEKPEDPTGRDLSTLVRARGDCVGCHDLIDPAGLALEHFDALGRWRDNYPSGRSIETEDTLRIGTEEVSFSGPVELMTHLGALPAAQECFARQVFRYQASRMETDDDACAVAQLASALDESDGRLDEAFLAVVRTDAFKYRRGD